MSSVVAASRLEQPRPQAHLPIRTRIDIMLRLLAIQGSWNYETLSGNGIGFCIEPALRLLPGGKNGEAFRHALARESAYFNSHPYLASIAIGALARAELDGEPPERIERFRTALCGPLGSVGDQLIWAGWLPFCSLVALAAFGLGAGALPVLAIFLCLYNAGHLWLVGWGLRTGWANGMRVAPVLAKPVFRDGPRYIGRAAAFATGLAAPIALGRILGAGKIYTGEVLVAVVVGTAVVVRVRGRVEGWQLALIILSSFALYSVLV